MDSLLIQRLFFMEFLKNPGQEIKKQRKSILLYDHGDFLQHIENLPDIGTAVRSRFQKTYRIDIDIFPLAFLCTADSHMRNLREEDAERPCFINRGRTPGHKHLPVSPDAVPDFQSVMEMKIFRRIHRNGPVFSEKSKNRKTGGKIIGSVSDRKALE